MKRLWHLLAVWCLLILVMEGGSCLLLGAIALRGGHVSTYFTSLLPHPALSRRLREIPPEVFALLSDRGHVGYGGKDVGYGGKNAGIFEWYPLVGHYRSILPDGTPRQQPAFGSNELVVYLLGGSAVEGGGSSKDLHAYLQAYLQTRLGDRYDVRVINEGVAGYMSTQEMVLLQTKIIPFGNPHYVVAVDGYNDWLATTYNLLNDLKGKTGVTETVWPRAELSWFYYWFEQWQARKALETLPGASAQFLRVLSQQVFARTYTGWLANHLRNWLTVVWLPRHGVRDPTMSALLAAYEHMPDVPRERAELHAINARMMAEACRVRDCRFLWVLQPILPCRGEARTAEERHFFNARPPAYWQSLERYYQDLRAVVRAEDGFWGPRFLDLSCPAPDVTGSFFTDTVHWTEAGANRIAEYAAALILADLEAGGPRQAASVIARTASR
ncbi:MAG TPA: hypothetical protein DD714_00290 [Candidatus Omnitrophica bacterium]|nr:hypothetical protein [Candidatus Omnitrophota bacterium]